MATTSVRPSAAPTKKSERPQPKETRSAMEDRIDYAMVRAARNLAIQRGEKPVPWSEFKKKLK